MYCAPGASVHVVVRGVGLRTPRIVQRTDCAIPDKEMVTITAREAEQELWGGTGPRAEKQSLSTVRNRRRYTKRPLYSDVHFLV